MQRSEGCGGATPAMAMTRRDRIDDLLRFVDTQRMSRKYAPGWFEEVEATLHRKVSELERELTADIMAGHDVDAVAIEIDGKAHRRVLRAEQEYMTTAGAVTVERWLYRDRDDDSAPSLSPMELRLGTIDFWTPQAAKTAVWVVSQIVPQHPRLGSERTVRRCVGTSSRRAPGRGSRACEHHPVQQTRAETTVEEGRMRVTP